jgi:hypothetical protein
MHAISEIPLGRSIGAMIQLSNGDECYGRNWGSQSSAEINLHWIHLKCEKGFILKRIFMDEDFPGAALCVFTPPDTAPTAVEQGVATDALQPSARASLPASGRG